MKVFVTGASGFVGSAVAQELLKAGHTVVGLVRSDASEKSLTLAGGQPLRGDLNDLETLRRGAAESDGVIHTGFIHDFSKFKESCELDYKVIKTMAEVLTDSNRPLIVTSGVAVAELSKGESFITENTIPTSSPNPRFATEKACQEAIELGANVSIVRLPPSTHGKGDHGFIPMLINLAREKGISAYIDGGHNKWSAVHRLDAAKVFCLALEKKVKGSYYHAVAEEGVSFKSLAEVIGEKLNLPVINKLKPEADAHFSWMTHFASMNVPALSKETQRQLGWRPEHIDLISDIRTSYFE